MFVAFVDPFPFVLCLSHSAKANTPLVDKNAIGVVAISKGPSVFYLE